MKKADEKFVARDEPSGNLEIVNAEGDYLIDVKGKKYIDFVMGWCVGNIGWGNKEVQEKIKQFDGPAYVNPHYLYRGWSELAELLAKITPGKLEKSFRATGGTEAVEIALQAAMSHTKRHKFISIEGSYHGHSIGAMSVGSSDFKQWYPNLLNHCSKIKPPLDAAAAAKVEKLLESNEIAALIMEPIVCNLGVVIPEQEFMKRVEKACRKHGTLLIIDEVATGFGRTGKLFAAEHFKINPDIICMAKGISGGYGGLGATITTPEVAKSMEFGFSFYSTYGWHPLATEAAIANIKYILKHQRELEQNTNVMSAYFSKRLYKMKFQQPAEIRIKGLAIGVEFKQSDYAVKIVERAREKGLLLSALNDKIITLFPSLNINKSVAKEGLDILEQSV